MHARDSLLSLYARVPESDYTPRRIMSASAKFVYPRKFRVMRALLHTMALYILIIKLHTFDLFLCLYTSM